jgi:hypothetical protein
MTHLKVDGEQIGSLLRSRGLSADRITPDTWRSHFRGTSASLPFFVRVDRNGYITFAIVPFLKSPKSPERATVLYRRLLELNQDLLMAKFSIDDDLDIVLSVEYPTRELDESEFDDAINVMSYYADKHFLELSRLA